MTDNDELYFSFDDDDEEAAGEDAGAVAAGEASNRSFIIAVGALAGLFLVGIGLIIFLLLRGGPGDRVADATPEPPAETEIAEGEVPAAEGDEIEAQDDGTGAKKKIKKAVK